MAEFVVQMHGSVVVEAKTNKEAIELIQGDIDSILENLVLECEGEHDVAR